MKDRFHCCWLGRGKLESILPCLGGNLEFSRVERGQRLMNVITNSVHFSLFQFMVFISYDIAA